jgi:hypothetical protein
MAVRPLPHQNRLLAVLPAAERAHLYSHLEPISMTLGEVLYESGSRAGLRLLPHDLDRVLALRHAGRVVRRDRRGRQGRDGRSFPLHGR